MIQVRSAALLLSILLVTGACSESAPIIVSVRTDAIAGVHFTLVDVTVFRSARMVEVERTLEYVPRPGDDFAAGVHVVTLDGITRSSVALRVRLLRPPSDSFEQRVIVDVDRARVINVQVSRSCEGLFCPDGTDEAATACLGGQCIDPRCAAGDDDFCPAPLCTTDGDCTAASCAPGSCERGFCQFLDVGRCGPSAYCDSRDGCFDASTGAPLADYCRGADECPLVPHVSPGCEEMRCAPTCDDGWAECDGDPTTGCETLLGTGDDCGTCGDACAWGVCIDGICDDPEAIYGGRRGACVRTRVGQALYCWNSLAGDGASTANALPTRVPLDEARRATLGFDHACAWADAEIWCWGENLARQLDGVGGAFSATPIALGAFTRVDVVSVGGRPNGFSIGSGAALEDVESLQTCALADDRLFCWGSIAARGSMAGRRSGVTELTHPMLVDLVDIVALSYGRGLARRSDGLAVYWRVREDVMGVRTVTARMVAGIDDTTTIASVERETDARFCALSSVGGITCFGEDLVLEEPAPGLSATEIALGRDHTCVLDDGRVLCWGENGSGQLGDGSLQRSATPLLVAEPSDVVSIVAIDAHATCALERSGIVWCWGGGIIDAGGLLGHGGRGSMVPVRVRPPRD